MAVSFDFWIHRLFERHLRELTHHEVARALRALSRDYVQRRGRLRGEALDGRGKRAAFALYYGPRHFLITREILAALEADTPPRIIDLGCGSGVAGAAWALRADERPPDLIGVDLHADVLSEAAQTWRDLGLRGGGLKCHIARYRWPGPPLGVVAAFTINELDQADRARLWTRLERQHQGGGRILVIEPLATRITPWWTEWADKVKALGGRADEWYFDVGLPEPVRLLGKSAGLRPEKLGARSLWL